MTESFGLGERWHEVVEALHKVMPIYDRVNHMMSFGRDSAYREEGIIGALPSADLVLDAGCGPGVMSEIAHKLLKIRHLVLLDPMQECLVMTRKRLNNKNCDMVIGLFEALPFKREVFDLVMCGFSLRDSMNMNMALKEISRVSKGEGKFVLVDLGKPDNFLKRFIIGFWWKFIAPSMTIILAKGKAVFYRAIYTTYKKLPRNSELKQMIKTRFDEVVFKSRMLEGIVIVTAKKSKHN
ncbi:MAG: class I SAM-dependent methyltransferase [Nitrososphaerales archaeon]|nr:class I SAM-dependent methyltransferase [Nitrososphaerales archaeon]